MPDHQNTAPQVTLHLVASLDGFIARRDNSISPEEAAAFVQSIDCYVLGSRTYEHALQLGWVYGDTPTIVVTTRNLPRARPTVEFYSGDLEELVHRKLASRFHNIWLVGGAVLSQRFLALNLVQEIKLTIAPVLLGNGLRLFDNLPAEQLWDLKNAVA